MQGHSQTPVGSASIRQASAEDKLARQIADDVAGRVQELIDSRVAILQGQLSRMEGRLDTLVGRTQTAEGLAPDAGSWSGPKVAERRRASLTGASGLAREASAEGSKVAERRRSSLKGASELAREGSARQLLLGNAGRGVEEAVEEKESETEEETSEEDMTSNQTLRGRAKSCLEAQEPERKGCVADVVRSNWFTQVSFMAVVFNTFYIWYEADYDAQHLSEHHPLYFQLIEIAFIAFYTVELFLKLYVHRCFYFWNNDKAWNIFDFVIVSSAVIELVGRKAFGMQAAFNPAFLRVSRLLRVVRVLRILRSIRMLDELRIMTQCVVGSILSLFWATILMLIILMISSIILVQQMTSYMIDNKDTYCDDALACQDIQHWFGSVGLSISALYQCTTGGLSWSDMLNRVQLAGGLATTFFVFCITFFQFAFFNIVTSIFVDQALKLAKPDAEEMARERKEEEAEMAEELSQLFDMVDADHSGVITVEEIKHSSKDPKVFHRFELLGITIRDVDTFFGTLTAMTPDGELDKVDFVEGCLKMKGGASSVTAQAILLGLHKMSNNLSILSISESRNAMPRHGV